MEPLKHFEHWFDNETRYPQTLVMFFSIFQSLNGILREREKNDYI